MFDRLDYFFNKVLPKKFIVFVAASVFLVLGLITGEHWFWIAVTYSGANVVGKLTKGVGIGKSD